MDRWCWSCGYPITAETERTVEGEHVFFRDGKTGTLAEECPNCGEWLEFEELLAALPPIGLPDLRA